MQRPRVPASRSKGSFSVSPLAILLAVVIVTSCGMGSAAGGSSEKGATASPATSAPTLLELANATFVGVFEEPVTLVDGRWEGEPYVDGGASRPSAGLVEHFALSGDIDGDERDETVVLLWGSSGGSGVRSYLAAVGRRNGDVVNLATSLVGDRVQVKDGSVIDRVIALEVVQAGPGDAACCPTQRARVEWQLEHGDLVRTTTEITGELSLEDLWGPDWILAAIGPEEVVSNDSPIRLHVVSDRVEGSGGCNTYFGTVTSATPGQLDFSAMGTTMMACSEAVMELERRYLRTLAGGSSYGFVAGRLAIGCSTDDGPVALVFKRSENAEPSREDVP